MKMVVENLTGTLFNVEAENEATVGDLKQKIGTHENLPADRLILITDDNLNNPINGDSDGFSLVDCGVKDGSHIYVLFTPLEYEPNHKFESMLPDSILEMQELF